MLRSGVTRCSIQWFGSPFSAGVYSPAPSRTCMALRPFVTVVPGLSSGGRLVWWLFDHGHAGARLGGEALPVLAQPDPAVRQNVRHAGAPAGDDLPGPQQLRIGQFQ